MNLRALLPAALGLLLPLTALGEASIPDDLLGHYKAKAELDGALGVGPVRHHGYRVIQLGERSLTLDFYIDSNQLELVEMEQKGAGWTLRFKDPFDSDDLTTEFHLEKVGGVGTLTGKAGDMTVHHVRLLHGSAPNRSDRARKILFYECARADAWP